MASSKLMASRSQPPNPDPPRHSDYQHSRSFASMDEILRNIYSDSNAFPSENNNGSGGAGTEMTLDDYLSKPVEDSLACGFGMGTVMEDRVIGVPAVASAALEVRNGGFGAKLGNGSGRGKRRAAVEEVAVDKATQQKQRRMIKNRESAARSRERKQAYTVELESLVIQLEEENATLLREEEDLNKERYKQLMEELIPVTEMRRPPRVLRRVQSMEW